MSSPKNWSEPRAQSLLSQHRLSWLCGLLVAPLLLVSPAQAQTKPKPAPVPVKTTKPTTPPKTPPKTPPQLAKKVVPVKAPVKETPSLFSEGVTAFKAGDYEKAEDIFRRAIVINPKDPVLHYFLGRTLKRRADCVGALSAFSAARAADVNATLPKETLAAEEIECQVLLTEIPVAPQASAATEARVALEEGQAAYIAGDFEGALKALEQAQENRPNDAKILYQKGLVLYSLGRYPESMKALQAANRLDPQLGFASPEDYRQALSRAQVRVGSNPEAGPHLFQDPYLNQALQDALRGIKEAGLYVSLPEDLAQQEALSSLLREGLAKDRTVVLLRAPTGGDKEKIADALWGMELQYHRPALLIVVDDAGAAVRDSDLPQELRAKIADAAKGKTAFEGLQAASIEAQRRYQEQGFYLALRLWGGLGASVLFLGMLLFAWRRRVARERAAFSSMRERLESKLLTVAESLAINRLSMKVAPHEVEPLLEAAEELYFFARNQSKLLPASKARKLPHWMAEEAIFSIEEAERKSKRAAKSIEASFGSLRSISSVEKQYGCFFCARPIANEEGGYLAKVSFRSAAQQVLACRQCANQINAGDPPQVKMVIRKGRRRHWSQTRAFEPRYDFYAPRIPIEMLSAVEAWGELFGDEGHTAMPEGGTLTSMPAIITSKENATVQLQLSESEPK